MLSGCHVTRAQRGQNTKRIADKAHKAQDWWRDVVGKGVGEDVKKRRSLMINISLVWVGGGGGFNIYIIYKTR